MSFFLNLIRTPMNLLTFLQIMEICLQKCSSLSMVTPSYLSSLSSIDSMAIDVDRC